jgi:hypothetical protein
MFTLRTPTTLSEVRFATSYPFRKVRQATQKERAIVAFPRQYRKGLTADQTLLRLGKYTHRLDVTSPNEEPLISRTRWYAAGLHQNMWRYELAWRAGVGFRGGLRLRNLALDEDG